MQKPKLSMYWAASCGGCEIALLNLHEKILDIDEAFDFMFCPCVLDTKKRDIEALPDGDIFVTLFNGAIGTEENREMAHLMRKKSRILIACGACATGGSIPALCNLSTSEDVYQAVYRDNPSTPNPSGQIPRQQTHTPEGVIYLPALLGRVRTLADEVAVDYFIPGCPPEPHRIWDVIEHLIQGKPLPPPGSVLGAGEPSLCDECERKKGEKKIGKFYRTYEIVPDREQCLLEQGIVCLGIVTRGGCGALCPQVNMPCTGCYGPPEGTVDQGAGMVAALGSIIDSGDVTGLGDDEILRRIAAIVEAIPDTAGTFYKYSLAQGILKGQVE